MSSIDEAIAVLRSTATIRQRCRQVYAAGEQGRLAHFRLHPAKLDEAARYVGQVMRESYPRNDIPYHSRWRHFDVGGIDRWAMLCHSIAPEERPRAAIDLATVSVLLDAGAGPGWGYSEAGAKTRVGRSEGLAVASLRMFEAGLFSGDPKAPFRVDADGLEKLTTESIARGLQVTEDNPLVGLSARVELLQRFGAALRARPDVFGTEARFGNAIAYLTRGGPRVAASAVLAMLLDTLSPIWPSGTMFHGTNLGDVARHPQAKGDALTDGLVPFHKLSQWLAYSLLEPLEWAGATVTGLDDLTGLPEYRNGGLFVDLGVLEPIGSAWTGAPLDPRAEPIVEWRALTVILLDETAARLRVQRGLTSEQLPLAKVLQGGTWTAGRKIAAEKRPGGPPPIAVATDGTTF
jgi:hypothetical protein